VMDLTGRTVLEKPVVAERTTVQLAHLPAGRYFMHVRMQDGKRQVCSFVKE